jgi:hypothetical protein
MKEIKSVNDWWEVVESYWPQLCGIIGDQMDISHVAFQEPGNSDSSLAYRDGRYVNIAQEIEYLRVERDRRLCRYFVAAWGLSSDAYAWSVPGWGALCDLCSEEWVFEEE